MTYPERFVYQNALETYAKSFNFILVCL